MALDSTDRAILNFEREWWRHAEDRAAAVRDKWDVDLDTYQTRIDGIIWTDAALAYDRMLVLRLRRLSTQRRRQAANGTTRRAAPPPRGPSGVICKGCGAEWPREQVNLRGRCPNCLWGAA